MPMNVNSFNRIWNRLLNTQGKLFYTKTGLPFRHKVEGYKIWINRSKHPTMKEDLKLCYENMPLENMPYHVWKQIGNSYIWSWLNDDRIMLNKKEVAKEYIQKNNIKIVT